MRHYITSHLSSGLKHPLTRCRPNGT